jgi:hypothetical protein
LSVALGPFQPVLSLPRLLGVEELILSVALSWTPPEVYLAGRAGRVVEQCQDAQVITPLLGWWELGCSKSWVG